MRARIDNLGKLEIPQEFRERTNLLPGSQVEVELSIGGGVHVRPISTSSGVGGDNGGQPLRLVREGSVLVVSGLSYDRSWENLVAAVREDHLRRSAGIQRDEDAD